MQIDRRLDALEAQLREPEDTRWYPSPSDGDAWLSVSAAEKDRLWAVFLRCGGSERIPALVRRWNGRWRLQGFNTPWGRVAYAFQQTMKELNEDAFLAWAGSQCSAQEIEALARMCQSGWNPEALEAGDTALLEGLIPRLPR